MRRPGARAPRCHRVPTQHARSLVVVVVDIGCLGRRIGGERIVGRHDSRWQSTSSMPILLGTIAWGSSGQKDLADFLLTVTTTYADRRKDTRYVLQYYVLLVSKKDTASAWMILRYVRKRYEARSKKDIHDKHRFIVRTTYVRPRLQYGPHILPLRMHTTVRITLYGS